MVDHVVENKLVLRNRWGALLVFGLIAVVQGFIVPPGPLAIILHSIGGTVVLLAVSSICVALIRCSGRARRRSLIRDAIENDASPCIYAATDGAVIVKNLAASTAFKASSSRCVSALFAANFADPKALVARLQKRATQIGAARENLQTRDGSFRLSAHGMTGGFMWRLESIADAGALKPRPSDHLLPMFMVSGSGAVLYMNETAREITGKRITALDQLIVKNSTAQGALVDVSTVDGPKQMIVAEVPATANRRALYLLPGDVTPTSDAAWQAFQQLPIPLIKVAPNGAVLSFNGSASTLVGPDLSDDSQLTDLMEGLGRSITDWLSDTLEGRLVLKPEFLRLKRKDRETFVQVKLNLIAENGQPALIAVLSDATELKSLEAQFVQSQKMQAIGQLAGGVAHDFNNLLTAISGHCDLLLLRHDQGDQDYGDLIQIDQNANRAAALVGQLLAFSRKQTLRPETLNMRDTLADLTHLLNRLVGERITLTLSHDPILNPIRADKRQLEQVIMNLVVNARDAMPDGGEIKVATECHTLLEPLVRDRVTVPVGQYVTVQVIDEGVGIAPDKVEKVFEPFFTTKRTGEGTGLGLSTAYGIVKQSGGYIFVDSTPEQGTTFSIYFPVFTDQGAKEITTDPPLATLGGNHDDGTVLLVEDEAPVRAFASRALRMKGYTVLEADSAEMALKTLEDKALNIDVFVTDVIMPGMDGPSWVRQALKGRPGVRVVFVSGYAEDSFGEAQSSIPNSVFLPKPFSLTELTNTVHRQMR